MRHIFCLSVVDSLLMIRSNMHGNIKKYIAFRLNIRYFWSRIYTIVMILTYCFLMIFNIVSVFKHLPGVCVVRR